MARGWESKAVEEQMNAAGERPRESGAAYDASPEVRARRARLETLRMSHARTRDQLGRVTSAAHRAMLERTLRALESEMAELA
ncbi:MAG TPA: hypothetical protein VFX96_03660 [Pyrinomonadaceae bacterium]|nr:hypothetical protein [Pyrinomonadaceae bacterium]